MSKFAIEGIHPVLYAMFDATGRLRQDGFRHQVDHCMDNGAGGVVLFGFVTQFYRLGFAEKIESLRSTVAAMQGRGQVGVTVMEPSPEGQAALIRAAREEGADWVILQPPLGPPVQAPDWLPMLQDQIGAAGLPVAVQNAAIASAQLSNAELLDLQAACPDLRAVKAETGTAEVGAFCRDHGHRFRILTGDWGVEYPFFARQGAHGLIPAPNFVPEQVAQHRAAQAGDWETVDAIQERILPLMQFFRERPAPEGQILLGKLAYGWRTGFDAGPNRAPGPQAVDAAIAAHARHLWERLAAGG
ncbi:dihydrodipicolinate synthase family protein [Mameliella sp.]|uniref:dihydrodipicolinate synthase family protein n=1 Tax=Mameliella sp. TaxID=1924940 RepID=UPI003BA8DBB4